MTRYLRIAALAARASRATAGSYFAMKAASSAAGDRREAAICLQSLGAIFAAASADVTTGTTSNSVMSLQFAIHSSSRRRS